MKKSEIAEIINRPTDLEIKIARGIHTKSIIFEQVALKQLNELTKITSDLDKIWKGKK